MTYQPLTPHDPHCIGIDSCRCAPTTQCPAVLIDGDGYAHRCIEYPGHGPDHGSDIDWAWTDPGAGITYSVEDL
ncbi:hypothetical protein [Embleya hyalina]|uniref:Uncharacterized protein n=1 Tax=Embleya hyalina TaxID=516124 RepID=A0A401YHL4_9ACTN|nr:hypothetical protein [Embleya hyalina]GCD94059.1 hypothetical protein EHYA_01715 [Embleya hyalina]